MMQGLPFRFPNTVYNAAGGYLSICSGIKGYNATVTNGAQSGLASVAYGCEIIRQNKGNVVLATGTDENCDVMESLYGKLGMVSNNVNSAYSEGTGFVLGDGSTSLVLESEGSLKARGGKAYAQVTGYGMSHKSVEFVTVEGSGEALDEAVRLACEDASISIDEIDAIVGFGNGMSQIDSVEVESYKRIFGDSFKNKTVFTVKDTTGEGRAASAALSAGHAALMLAGRLSDECKGYIYNGDKMEPAVKQISDIKKILVTSYGIGGSYCAVIIEK